MKYAHLVQIAEYLGKFKKISSALRVSDMALKIEFSGGERLFFDLSKADSAIYKNENFTQAKIYQAPFDNVLKKRLNGAYIQSVECLKNNRILKFTCAQTGSYKSVKTHLYLEFTGRFTNAVITDEAEVIVEALRHVDNSYRKIETGEVLAPLEAFEIKEKPVAPIENFDDFFNKFINLKDIRADFFAYEQDASFNEILFINSLYKAFYRLFRLHSYIKINGRFDVKEALGYAPPPNIAQALKTQCLSLNLKAYAQIFKILNAAESELKTNAKICKSAFLLSCVLELQNLVSTAKIK